MKTICLFFLTSKDLVLFYSLLYKILSPELNTFPNLEDHLDCLLKIINQIIDYYISSNSM